MTKISTDIPKIYARLNKEFGVEWDKGVIITYGGIIHCKSGKISPDLLVHELVHVKQQEGWDADEYAEKYLTDKQFRYDMEIEAYKAQAEWLRRNVSDVRQLHRILVHIWTSLSTMYGELISFEEAQEII
jgi:hypothetical protein